MRGIILFALTLLFVVFIYCGEQARDEIAEAEFGAQIIEMEDMTGACIEHQGSVSEMGMLFGDLVNLIQNAELEIVGAPYSVWYFEDSNDFNPEDAKYDICFPVGSSFESTEELKHKEYGGGLMAIYTHKGPYDDAFHAAYAKLQEYILQEGYQPASPIFEVYVVGPGNEGVTEEDYITEMRWPILIQQ